MSYFNNCFIVCGAYFTTIWVLATKTFLIIFQCLLKGKLEIRNGKNGWFQVLKRPQTLTFLPQRSLQEILISSDLAVSEWRSIKPP